MAERLAITWVFVALVVFSAATALQHAMAADAVNDIGPPGPPALPSSLPPYSHVKRCKWIMHVIIKTDTHRAIVTDL